MKYTIEELQAMYYAGKPVCELAPLINVTRQCLRGKLERIGTIFRCMRFHDEHLKEHPRTNLAGEPCKMLTESDIEEDIKTRVWK